MRKMFLAMVLVLMLAVPAFAEWDAEATANVEVLAISQPIFEAAQPIIQPSTIIPNGIPQLQFGTVKAIDAPIIDLRVKPLQKDDVLLQVLFTKTTTVDNLFETMIKGVRNVNGKAYDMAKVRIVVFEKLSTKMWSTGSVITGSGAGPVNSGSMGGSGGVLPSFGRMTADSKFVVQLILVVGK